MAFKLNRANQFAINGKTLAAGVYNWSESASYKTDETEYYDGDGFVEMDVLSISRDFTFQCHKVDADQAATFVWGKRNATGADAKTTLKWTDVDSTEKNYNVTIHDVVLTGGNAGDKFGFEFKLHINSEIVTD